MNDSYILELCNSIDNIDIITLESEINMIKTINESYSKASMIIEHYKDISDDNIDYSSFDIFSEDSIIQEESVDPKVLLKTIGLSVAGFGIGIAIGYVLLKAAFKLQSKLANSIVKLNISGNLKTKINKAKNLSTNADTSKTHIYEDPNIIGPDRRFAITLLDLQKLINYYQTLNSTLELISTTFKKHFMSANSDGSIDKATMKKLKENEPMFKGINVDLASGLINKSKREAYTINEFVKGFELIEGLSKQIVKLSNEMVTLFNAVSKTDKHNKDRVIDKNPESYMYLQEYIENINKSSSYVKTAIMDEYNKLIESTDNDD